jgi:hypothetical protein
MRGKKRQVWQIYIKIGDDEQKGTKNVGRKLDIESVREPLQNPCRTLAELLQNPCRTLAKPLQNPCKTLAEPLQNPCRTLAELLLELFALRKLLLFSKMILFFLSFFREKIWPAVQLF